MSAESLMATAVTMTGLEFDALPLEQSHYLELLDGEVLPDGEVSQMARPTMEHQEIVFNVLLTLKQHLETMGAAVSQDCEFALTSDTRLSPDVWVVLPPRSREMDRSKSPIPGAPDLAVEVISPRESGATSMRKVEFYLDHGTQEVWQVYPTTLEVVIHGPHGQMRKCRGDEALASWLVADLAIPVSRFFASE